MKKRLCLVIFCLCSVSLFGQVNLRLEGKTFSISGKANERIEPLKGDPIEIGTKVTLKELSARC